MLCIRSPVQYLTQVGICDASFRREIRTKIETCIPTEKARSDFIANDTVFLPLGILTYTHTYLYRHTYLYENGNHRERKNSLLPKKSVYCPVFSAHCIGCFLTSVVFRFSLPATIRSCGSKRRVARTSTMCPSRPTTS